MPVSQKFKDSLVYGASFAAILGLGYAAGAAVTSGKKEILEERVKVLEAEGQKRESHEKDLLTEVARCQTKGAVGPEDGKGGEPGDGLKLTVAAGDTGDVGGRLII